MNTDSVEQNTEIDKPYSLPEELARIMGRCGVQDTRTWMNGLPEDAFNNPNVGDQRRLVNRHVRMLFGDLPEDKIAATSVARGCLMEVDVCELADYIRLFRTRVIPCMVDNGLLK